MSLHSVQHMFMQLCTGKPTNILAQDCCQRKIIRMDSGMHRIILNCCYNIKPSLLKPQR